ncbi:DNA cytosine methyltransferase [Bacillus pseudomycoides]|uniref:DNA cytosine methyltransferase n=1 Tax=Bacillus pseudomycoides TaxID=64104 RepID=UPI0001A13C07|nr:DNA cytosine methyltransferase [Bacillus pseudomycoides]EEM02686.1 Phage-related DNA methylase [Bacillus pseudomycoides]KFN11612.1 C-5 cytosine-specific DNA methylase family protein [Bacillus pseudomycoides]MDR4188532.1 DNA cytosine methyltransferase [Bacillus pseudomycoides]
MGLTFLDIFAGVGGFRLGMEQAGHCCVGFIERDKFARASYKAIHRTEKEWTKRDINGVPPAFWKKTTLRAKVISLEKRICKKMCLFV